MQPALSQEPEINKLFRVVMMTAGSALNLAVGHPPMARVRGNMRRMDCAVLTDHHMVRLLHAILSPEQGEELKAKGSVDFTHVVGKDEARFRCRVSTEHGRAGLYARLLEENTGRSSIDSSDNG
jgi:twitching motility protein PilT